MYQGHDEVLLDDWLILPVGLNRLYPQITRIHNKGNHSQNWGTIQEEFGTTNSGQYPTRDLGFMSVMYPSEIESRPMKGSAN